MEYIDIVDENDNVVGVASQSDIYANLHPHRIVHVLVFNSNGQMILQLRSKHKSFAPHHWSTAVGGNVQTGETYEQAALREFQEELGVTAQLEFLSKDLYNDDRGLKKFVVVFKEIYDGEFV